VQAGKRAERAIAANPEKSDRAIAAEIGVDHKTVGAARRRTGEQSPDQRRTGRDGKRRSLPRRAQARHRKAEPTIDPTTLSASSRQRLHAALRRQKREQEREFEQRVMAEVERRLNEMALPFYHEQIETMLRENDEKVRLIQAHKGLMEPEEFNLIMKVLHPDSVTFTKDDALIARHNEALRVFLKYEIALRPAEKTMPPPPPPYGVPRDRAEWEKRKAATTAARKAQRAERKAQRQRAASQEPAPCEHADPA
jgi:hypothetical protein